MNQGTQGQRLAKNPRVEKSRETVPLILFVLKGLVLLQELSRSQNRIKVFTQSWCRIKMMRLRNGSVLQTPLEIVNGPFPQTKDL
jgi:hypothetical protein